MTQNIPTEFSGYANFKNQSRNGLPDPGRPEFFYAAQKEAGLLLSGAIFELE